MKKNKAKKTSLRIPDDFKGFSYKELQTRLAVMSVKRDMMKERLDNSISRLRGQNKTSEKEGVAPTVLSLFAKGFKAGSGIPSAKIGTVITAATMGFKVFNFLKKRREKKKARKNK